VRILLAEGLRAKDIQKEMFPVIVGKYLSRKVDHHWFMDFFHGCSKLQIMKQEGRKWLRQLSDDLYAMSFNALVKLCGKCINVGGGHVKK
jgi:hypothetical protein